MKIKFPKNTTAAHKRFKIYFIDSGWDSPAHRAFEGALSLVTRYLTHHDLVILGHARSEKFLQNHPRLIGADPLIAILDPAAIRDGNCRDKGILLLIGQSKTEERARIMFKMFLRLVNTRKMADHLPEVIRRLVHKEGMSGTFEIILDTLAHVETESDIPIGISEQIDEEDK